MKKLVFGILMTLIFSVPLIAQPVEYFIPEKSDLIGMSDSITELVKHKPEIQLKELDVYLKSLTVLQDKILKAKPGPINVTPEVTALLEAHKSLHKILKAKPDIYKQYPKVELYILHLDQMQEWMADINEWLMEERRSQQQ
jgi:hypothetical protein